MTLDRRRVDDLVALVRKSYPEWSGCRDPRFLADEIDYKRGASARAREQLGWGALEGMMARGEYDGIIKRLDTIGNATNILFTAIPRTGDLGILHAPGLDIRSFCDEIIALLYGQSPSTERLERYIEYVRSQRLPNKWAFPTYLLFLCHPESEIVVKPETMKWLLGFLGIEGVWSGTPQSRAYGEILRLAHELRSALEPYDAVDMIDVQSVIWVAASLAPRYWKISPGENAWQWEECRKGNFIGVGWELFGDVSRMNRTEFDERYEEIMRSFPELRDDPGWKRNGVSQLWTFAHEIRPDDVIVANRGTREVLGAGRVAGSYYFASGQRNAHRLPVIWNETRRQVYEEGWNRTLVPLDERTFVDLHADPPGLVAEENARYSAGPDGKPREAPPRHATQPEYPLERCAAETGFEREMLERWIRAIERKGEAIIYGPPGTGKTFIAERLARHLVGGGDGFYEVIQLHPAYAYEDFILGIRPQTRPDGGIEYPLVPGRFLRFCEEARERSGRCVLLLDEINRANLARVFGELMYLLEYRDVEVPLAGGIGFSVPSNVLIIGTMNTADRSIALVDHALRRRFAFLSLWPNYDVIRRYHEQSGFPVEPLVETLQRVNREINDPHYEIGISYFLRPRLDEQIEDIWRMEIEPYLEEYFFDQPAKVAAFRWDAIRERMMP